MEYDSDDEDKNWPKNFEHKQNLKDNTKSITHIVN